MKLGTESKGKVIFLAVLGALVLYLFYDNVLSSPSTGTPSASAPAANQAVNTTPAAGAPATPPASSLTGNSSAAPQRRGLASRGAPGDFHPKLRSNRPEDRIDPAKVDPTLHLDLLAKVQSVPLEGGSRNLFQFGAAAPAADLNPIKSPAKIPINKPVAVVNAPPAQPPGPPPPPPVPPLPFKYYGYSSARGETRKKAFLLEGEEIIVTYEGEMIKNRYRVVRVGVNSIEMEDTQFKSRQTLPLQEEAIG